jgi:flagellar protein FlgJ
MTMMSSAVAGMDTAESAISATDLRINHMKSLTGSSKGASAEKISETAQDFEAQFLSQMMENMFSTVGTNPEFGGGDAEEVYRSLLVNEYGKLLSRAGGIGIADHVKGELLRMQEASHA